MLAPPSYPTAVAGSFLNMATNLRPDVPLASPGSSVVFELLLDGVPVPGFTVTYLPGESGIKTVAAGPVPFAVGQTIDVRITNNGAGLAPPFLDASATVGVE